MIIHSICVSALKMSVESVVESLTSKFGIHFNKFRNVNQDTTHNEMISCDGGYETIFQRAAWHSVCKKIK